MEKKNRKIGIMGGTFDPIHIGHLILGEAAYEQFGLDEVWFLPAGNPPHKRNRAGQAKDAQRVEMVRRAIASNPHFVLCTKEMKDEGYTYSYRTLEAMRKEHPGTEFYFIIGADSLGYLSVENVQKLAEHGGGFCTACFSGSYPTQVPAHTKKYRFERKLSEKEPEI